MKKLIVCHPDWGDKELTVKEDIKTEFERIMKEGYATEMEENMGLCWRKVKKQVPAVFHATYTDGHTQVYTGEDAGILLDEPFVEEVIVIAPIAGG